MSKPKQTSFLKQKALHQFSHGGSLRNHRAGRSHRPLSCKDPLHVVLKINKYALKGRSLRASKVFQLTQNMIRIYSKKFFVKVEQISIQNDHIHLLIRTSRRSLFHHFFRVVAGQIAQNCQQLGLYHQNTESKHVTDTPTNKLGKKVSLWKHRPFSRVVKGYRAYRRVRNYIQLNENEALGETVYQVNRLRGMTAEDIRKLWS
jgi:putative transposase